MSKEIPADKPEQYRWWEKVRPELLRKARTLVPCYDDARDLVDACAEVLAVTIEGGERFDTRAHLAMWVWSVLEHKAKHLRKKRARRGPAWEMKVGIWLGEQPHRTAERRAAARTIEPLVEMLPPRLRRLVRLECEELSNREIAAELGVTVQTVYEMRARAIEKMKASAAFWKKKDEGGK